MYWPTCFIKILAFRFIKIKTTNWEYTFANELKVICVLIAVSSSGLKIIINPLIEEYMSDVIVNNYLSEGIILGIDYVFEPIMSHPLLISPGLCFTYNTNSLFLYTVEVVNWTFLLHKMS